MDRLQEVALLMHELEHVLVNGGLEWYSKSVELRNHIKTLIEPYGLDLVDDEWGYWNIAVRRDRP